MKNYFTPSLLAFLLLLSSVSPSISCEKETPAQFRARYKAHAKRLGILEGVDIRTLSNDDLKNSVLPYLALNLGIIDKLQGRLGELDL